jgi:DNA-binding response OmpR family regulator
MDGASIPIDTPREIWQASRTLPILLVDDDRELVELLAFSLRRAGLEPIAAHDAADALRCFEQHHPEVVVLDINLEASGGTEVVKQLRQRGAARVIILSALQSEEHKVRALEAGADDYVTKPFSHRELIARIRAHLRRSSRLSTAPARTDVRLQVGSVTLDPATYSVIKAGQPVSLTVTEFRLLHYLMTSAGKVVPIEELLKQVWGWGYQDMGGSDVVRVTVHRLRGKLEYDPSRPQLLRTIPGVGIQFNSDTEIV